MSFLIEDKIKKGLNNLVFIPLKQDIKFEYCK